MYIELYKYYLHPKQRLLQSFQMQRIHNVIGNIRYIRFENEINNIPH